MPSTWRNTRAAGRSVSSRRFRTCCRCDRKSGISRSRRSTKPRAPSSTWTSSSKSSFLPPCRECRPDAAPSSSWIPTATSLSGPRSGSNGEEHFAPGTTVSAGPVTSWVAEKKEPLLVSAQEDIPLPMKWKRNGYQGDSFLSIPLIEEGRVLGVLHLTNKKGNQALTRDDLAAFEPIARELTAILSQGILFRENVKTFSISILRSLGSAL